MRRLLVLSLAVLAAVAHADNAPAACAAAVVVDGRLLYGNAVPYPKRRPPVAGELPAIQPACNDGGPIEADRPRTVGRLRGVPPQVGVAGPAPDSVYVDEASLTVLGSHPLHAAFYRRRATPSDRDDRRCRAYGTAVHGQVVEDGGLRIRTARRTVSVRADAATRFTNRPAYEPVRKGQRVRIASSLCGTRRVADRVTFVGPTPAPAPYHRQVAQRGGLDIPGWLLVLLGLIAFPLLLIAVLWRVLCR